mmetsp:Transcript_9004/g.26987  ORF Transcript_9004/g.26987 Transcript_9004/m.26987 type:complete len:680 (-) Transcript_9004:862-2901(-)
MVFSLHPFKLCREQVVDGPLVLGMETARAFGSGYWFGKVTHQEGPWVMPIVTFGILTFMALRTLAYGKNSLLRRLIAFYIFATALVEIVRIIWDVSRFALIFAALHNLPEVALTAFLAFPLERGARGGWVFAQFWFLVITQFIMFLPTLPFVGLAEEWTGLGCDWALAFMWYRLYKACNNAEDKDMVRWGLLGAWFHMLEILPLLALLLGVFPVPSIPGCLIVSFTTPITMQFYTMMVDKADERAARRAIPGREDEGVPAASGGGVGLLKDDAEAVELISVVPEGSEEPYTGLSVKGYAKWIGIGLAVSFVTILLLLVIPLCDVCDMKVVPGHEMAWNKPLIPSVDRAMTDTHSGQMADGSKSPKQCPGPVPPPMAGEQLVLSMTKVAGTTKVYAYPGQETKLQHLLGSMPGAVQKEEGCIYYKQIVGGPTGNAFMFVEAWSSMRTLYKHLLLSPTVSRVFGPNSDLSALAPKKNITLDTNFNVMIPRQEAALEVAPWTQQFEAVINASAACLWKHIDNWSSDYSWVMGAKGITALSPTLRIVHFNTLNLTETRQVFPLAPPEQPQGGYRLAYWLLDGYMVGDKAESYKGELTLTPVPGDTGKTLLTYEPTIVPLTPGHRQDIIDSVTADFDNLRMPFLKTWGQKKGDKCRRHHTDKRHSLGSKWFSTAADDSDQTSTA